MSERLDSNTVRPDSPGSESPAQVGKVFLVGAGPGDPELLTLKAARLLAQAEVVVFDHLVGDGVMDLIHPAAIRIYAGKEAGRHALPQHEINALLVSEARKGRNIVRLKGGDPFIFGRGGEEMEALVDAGIACEVVPGITAASGISACTGMPLTHRDHARALVFATGHLKDGTVNLDWHALARPDQTVVIYMGLGALEVICERLVAHGLPPATPAAIIHKGTTPEQRTLIGSLASLPDDAARAGLHPPALIMIGSVVALHDRLMPEESARLPLAASTCTPVAALREHYQLAAPHAL